MNIKSASTWASIFACTYIKPYDFNLEHISALEPTRKGVKVLTLTITCCRVLSCNNQFIFNVKIFTQQMFGNTLPPSPSVLSLHSITLPFFVYTMDQTVRSEIALKAGYKAYVRIVDVFLINSMHDNDVSHNCSWISCSYAVEKRISQWTYRGHYGKRTYWRYPTVLCTASH